jgi:hypothetical protein
MENRVRKNRFLSRLTLSMITVCLLILGLAVTSFALIYSSIRSEDHKFGTGTVDINLNDGKKVVDEDGLFIAPGESVTRTFFIENNSTTDVYYRFYFENLTGDLAKHVKVCVNYGETVVTQGMISQLTRDTAVPASDLLVPGERRDLTVTFTLVNESGRDYGNNFLSFDLSADAVQAPNNPDKDFGNNG